MVTPAADAVPRLGAEQVPANEAQATQQMTALQQAISQANGPDRRGQHPKAHGCVEATFSVPADLPPELRAGVFAVPGAHAALVRFSNGGAADDRSPDVRGMAIKLLGVAGPRAADGDDSHDQDFTLIDSETFFADSVATLLGFMAARVAAAKAGNNDALTAFARAGTHQQAIVQRVQESLHADIPSPLAIRYWSTVPYRCGALAVKYSVRPADGNGSAAVPAAGPDYLRECLVEHLTRRQLTAAFDFCVQVQRDPVTMPIEDPTVSWPTPEVRVAILTIAPQTFDTPEHNRRCEETVFTPWHALAVHQPLGGINRARRPVYAAGAALRAASHH